MAAMVKNPLTIAYKACNAHIVTVKSVAGIDLPSVSRRSNRADLSKRGFSVVGRMGEPQGSPFPTDGKVNPVRPAARDWPLRRSGLETRTVGEPAMSANTTPGPNASGNTPIPSVSVQLLEEQSDAVDRLAALHNAAYSIAGNPELEGLYDDLMRACTAKISRIDRLCATLLKQGERG